MELVGPDTGFAHLGPLIEADCGKDLKVNVDFPIYTELFSIFTGSLCPPGGQTVRFVLFLSVVRSIASHPPFTFSSLSLSYRLPRLAPSIRTLTDRASSWTRYRWRGPPNSSHLGNESSQILITSIPTSTNSCLLPLIIGSTT